MRITDVALSTATPVSTRPTARRTETGGSSPTVVANAPKASGAQHPDEVAAAALQRAAGAAQASRVVAAENQRASDSVRGDIDPARVLQNA